SRTVLCYSALTYSVHRALRSFPTRRSSDLIPADLALQRPERLHDLPGEPAGHRHREVTERCPPDRPFCEPHQRVQGLPGGLDQRSEEHTSELQSRENLVCRLLLEKKKKEQL